MGNDLLPCDWRALHLVNVVRIELSSQEPS